MNDEARCHLLPGGPECGASPQKRVVGCGGTYPECLRYGNEKNFGGFPGLPEGHAPATHESDPTDYIIRGWKQEKIALVPAYEVGGTIFRNRPEATQAAVQAAFVDWYDSNKLCGIYEGSCVEARDFLEWAKDNRHALAKLLKTMV